MKATFGAGCFWGVEAALRKVAGVVDTQVGYASGDLRDPSYEAVCAGGTGHTEVVEVTYDPKRLSYEQLLDVFFSIHDATAEQKRQYRSLILVHTPEQEREAEAAVRARPGVVTAIEVAGPFYRAEDYHQRYFG